jgi:hypothetical protein
LPCASNDLYTSHCRHERAHPAVYARTVTGPDGRCFPEECWQPLEAHLVAVADRAAEFATTFGVPEWARLAGLWHDLGKYHPDFQQMLRDVAAGKPKGRVDHATAGAIHADRLIRAPLHRCGARGLKLPKATP